MEGVDLIRGKCSAGVVHISLPEGWWLWVHRQGSLLYIVHDKIRHCDRHRRSHGYAKGLLVKIVLGLVVPAV